MISERLEQYLKNFALLLGVISVVTIVLDLYPWTMFVSLPFCLIWVYCGWLRTEPQLMVLPPKSGPPASMGN